MSNEIQQSKSFEDRMRDRIRESIGDLIDDETLTKLIHSGIQKTFFQERLIAKSSTFYGKDSHKEPLIVEILKELLEEQVREAVDEYIKSNHDEIMEQIKQVVDSGVGMSVVRALTSTFKNDLIDFQMNVDQKFRDLGNN
jgi:Glu-tRNA(Gln) amidotransferase subunit E-like FAD-binding protein